MSREGRVISWFSCGAASACALKLVAAENPMGVYCDTSLNEHPDNARFIKDVEDWTGIKITKIHSKKFSTVEEVFSWKKYMSGVGGAPCTVQLKKVPRFEFQEVDDVHIFGFTVDEQRRITRFEADNCDLRLRWPLLQAKMNKEDCFSMLRNAGIALPAMYGLGFKNNNCIGCVKSTSPHYWNMVRKHFPDVFQSRAEQSRSIGCKLVQSKGKRIFLDELPADNLDVVIEDLSCGPQCSPESLAE